MSVHKLYGNLSTSVVPAVEPVTLAEAKIWLRVTSTTHNALITSLIKAARELCETITKRTFITTTYQMTLAKFPSGVIELMRPPVQSVTSLEYRTGTGAYQTWDSANYYVDTTEDPGSIQPVNSWPTITLEQQQHVRITFVAGYGTATTDVPESIRAAINAHVSDVYEHPMTQTELVNGLHPNRTVQLLLDAYTRREM